MVEVHVDELGGTAHAAEGGFAYGVGLAHEGDDSAVGGLARVDVEEADAFDALDGVGDGFYGLFVAAFREVGHTFDDFFHGIRGLNYFGELKGEGIVGK